MTISLERMAEVFVEVSDTLVVDFDLIEFLEMVTTRAAELIDASAAGLLLADPYGRLEFMAASSEGATLLELYQVQNHEGPCLDAFHSGVPVTNADLTQAADRWPRFAPRAAAAGFLSVHAIPLRLRSDVVGALNLFGDRPGILSAADLRVVQALADLATIGLLQARAIHRSEILAEQLQAALNSRVVIEQAKGALAQLLGVGVDDAFHALRSYARRNHRRLLEVATAVVNDPSSVPDLSGR